MKYYVIIPFVSLNPNGTIVYGILLYKLLYKLRAITTVSESLYSYFLATLHVFKEPCKDTTQWNMMRLKSCVKCTSNFTSYGPDSLDGRLGTDRPIAIFMYCSYHSHYGSTKVTRRKIQNKLFLFSSVSIIVGSVNSIFFDVDLHTGNILKTSIPV